MSTWPLRYLSASSIPVVLLFVFVLAHAARADNGAVTVESMFVRAATLRYSVDTVGTVVADASAVLRAEVPGQSLALHFDDGQRIGQGKPLYSFKATVLEAKANVEQHEAAYNRWTWLTLGDSRRLIMMAAQIHGPAFRIGC